MLMRSGALSGGGAGSGGTGGGGAGCGTEFCGAGSGAVVGVVVQAADSNRRNATTRRVELVTETDTHDIDFGGP